MTRLLALIAVAILAAYPAPAGERLTGKVIDGGGIVGSQVAFATPTAPTFQVAMDQPASSVVSAPTPARPGARPSAGYSDRA
jgi:hypothetical protein